MKRAIYSLTLVVLAWAGTTIFLQAQSPTPAAQAEKKPDKPYVRINETAWGPNGELVLAVRIYAGKSEFLLGSFGKIERGNNSGIGSPKAFSLEGTTLEDLLAGQKFTALQTRIQKPYFGPNGTALKLAPHGWVQLGIAFPHPPSPGKNKDGKMNPYSLRYYPPEGMDPVDLEVPFDKSAEAAAKAAVR